MSHLSRLRRKATKRTVYNLGYGDQTVYKSRVPKVVKKPKTFLEYSLTEADLLFMMDTENIYPEYNSGIKLNLFPSLNIRCDKIALIYAKKKKLFMMLGLNDNYTGFVLYKDKDVYKLPNVFKFDLDIENFHVNENSNRLMNSLIDKFPDCTSNPIHIYKTNELFSK